VHFKSGLKAKRASRMGTLDHWVYGWFRL